MTADELLTQLGENFRGLWLHRRVSGETIIQKFCCTLQVGSEIVDTEGTDTYLEALQAAVNTLNALQ